MGLPSPKESLQAAERDPPRIQQARADYRQLIATLDVRRLQCGDESGVQLAMPRLSGRASSGERAIGSVPQRDGSNVPRLGTLGAQGLQAVMTGEGATDADVLRTDGKRVLGPTWRPGGIVVTDHLRAHKAVGGQQALARRGARLVSWPPDSPDLSPIEPGWSKVNTARRTAEARPRRALDTAITQTLPTVTRADAHGWLRPCGYALQ